jgi:hypothetical protein
MITDWESVSQLNASNPLNIESNFIGEHVARALHARLFCGVKFFDATTKRANEDIAPCILKMACVQLAKLTAKGGLSEEVTRAETEFAAKGDISRSRRSSTHPLCRQCDQDLCPIWKLTHGNLAELLGGCPRIAAPL